MKPPQVRERDLVNGALLVSSRVLLWQECDVAEEGQKLNELEESVVVLAKLVKRFRKEQLA